jgi:hypothetical protein
MFCERWLMTSEADQLLAVALKKVGMGDGFSPAELGARVGLNKMQAEGAARVLANAGVLVLGFDHSAEFSDDFRRSKSFPANATSKRKGRPAKARPVTR